MVGHRSITSSSIRQEFMPVVNPVFHKRNETVFVQSLVSAKGDYFGFGKDICFENEIISLVTSRHELEIELTSFPLSFYSNTNIIITFGSNNTPILTNEFYVLRILYPTSLLNCWHQLPARTRRSLFTAKSKSRPSRVLTIGPLCPEVKSAAIIISALIQCPIFVTQLTHTRLSLPCPIYCSIWFLSNDSVTPINRAKLRTTAHFFNFREYSNKRECT